ncbi:MAG: type 3 dihydrofolate reductase [Gammaproteobacteria bacterium]|jgi:dihydrofolate reductase
MISLIAAMTKDHAIGKDNRIPWHLSADLKYFKKMTLHKPIIMGRRTFESLGKALPERTNIVVTQQDDFKAQGCEIAHSLHQAIKMASPAPEIMIIGGGQLYQEAIKIANRMYLTLIDTDTKGDTFFPKWNENEWHEISRETHHKDAENPYDYSFVVLERK